VLTEYEPHEMATLSERKLWNALKFETSGEVDSKEGVAQAEGYLLPPPNFGEVGKPQVDLNGAVGESLVLHPRLQCIRTKLLFDVFFDDPFLD